MENINKKNTSLTEENNLIKENDLNKVEWINYFNEGLIVESINNGINNSLNQNKKLSNINYDKNNHNFTSYSYNNYNKNINKTNNIKQDIIKTKETLIQGELYENKNYYFTNIKELYGPKKIISFDYEEKIIFDDYSDKFNLFKNKNKYTPNKDKDKDNDEDDFGNRRYKNVIVINNDNNNNKNANKGKVPKKEKLNNGNNIDDDNDKLRNKNKKINKSVDLNGKNKNKIKDKDKDKDRDRDYKNLSEKKYNRNKLNNIPNGYPHNKTNNVKNKNNYNNYPKFDYRTRYNYESSYAQRHKMKKQYEIDGHFHPNEEKPITIGDHIFLGRTLPEMIVLNNHGMVNDNDYEMFQKILNYNKLNKKRTIKKSQLKFYKNNNNPNNANYINSTNIPKSTLQQNSNEGKNKDETIQTSYL